MKIFGWICAGFAAFSLIGFALTLLGLIALPFNIMNQGVRVINKTVDADNVIYNYEWFKQQCQDIEAQATIIAQSQASFEQFKNDAGPREKWTYGDVSNYNTLSANVTGAKNNREKMIADYNARARERNRAIFNTEPCYIQVTQ